MLISFDICDGGRVIDTMNFKELAEVLEGDSDCDSNDAALSVMERSNSPLEVVTDGKQDEIESVSSLIIHMF